MKACSDGMKSGFMSVISTTLFCIVIATATRMIWPSSWFEHVAISLGFGYSAVFSSLVLSRVFPKLSSRVVNILSLSTAMLLGTVNAHLLLNQYQGFTDVSDIKSVAFLGFIFTAACFFYFYAHEQKLLAQKQLEVARREQVEQEKALILSQLKQLQSQIEPHFLFNTLANISALIDHEPKGARLMLEKLTELLRGTLNNTRQTHQPLHDELALVDAYLGIQKIRLGSRLVYTIKNTVSDISICLPPLLVQPLVENAIQHGIEPKSEGGTLIINSSLREGRLVISVADTGLGLNQHSPHQNQVKQKGIGLENIRQRLNVLFADEALLKVSENESGGVTSVVEVSVEALMQLSKKQLPNSNKGSQ